MYQLDFADFDETEFEEFCFELLKSLPGFHNVDWRKRTRRSRRRDARTTAKAGLCVRILGAATAFADVGQVL